MGSELVLACDREPTLQMWREEAQRLLGDHTVKVFGGMVTQLLTPTGRPVCSWWDARHLENTREATALLGRDPGTALWVDIVLPYRLDQPGLDLAARVAERVDGVLWRRSGPQPAPRHAR